MTVYDDPRIHQTIAGVDYVTSLGGTASSRAIDGIVAQLIPHEAEIGWLVLPRPELRIDGDITVPDVVGWRRARMQQMSRDEWFAHAPDWTCDVATPETGLLVRRDKLAAYKLYGVGYAWVVDPQMRTLDVYRREGNVWFLHVTYGGDDTVRIEPFDAIEFPLATLWLPEVPSA